MTSFSIYYKNTNNNNKILKQPQPHHGLVTITPRHNVISINVSMKIQIK